MASNKNFDQIINELFVRGKKLNASNVFLLDIFSAVLEDVRLSCTNMFILKIPKKSFKKLHLVIHQILNLNIS